MGEKYVEGEMHMEKERSTSPSTRIKINIDTMIDVLS